MKTQNNIPALRFPEFDGEWNEKKLKNVSTYFNGGSFENDVKEEGKYELITLKSVDMSGNLAHSKRYIDSDVTTLRNDTLIMILSEQAPGLLGMTALIPEENKYVLNQRVAEIRPKDNIVSYFLSMAINRNQQYFSKHGAGTKVQNISKPNVENYTFLCPELPEQLKIASFLSAVDEKIQQLTRKAALLEQYKKGIMQQLFSGTLRFKDDDGKDFPEWEEKKLNQVFLFKQGIQCGVENQFIDKSENMERFIRIIDLTSENEIPRFIINYDKDNILNEDDLFMVRYGVPGLVGYGYNGVIANNLFRLIPKKNIYNKFYYYVLTHLNREIMNLSSSTTMPALNFSSLGILKIPLIHLKEQQKIASFLSGIDDKIGSVNGQLEKTQRFKKGLLQGMFV